MESSSSCVCRFEEVQALRQMQFDFADKPSPVGYVSSLAQAMQTCPGPDVLLNLHHVPQTYDEAAIHDVLDHLTPERVQIMWSSKDFQVGCLSDAEGHGK